MSKKKKKDPVYDFLFEMVSKIIDDELSLESPDTDVLLENIQLSADVYHQMEDFLGKRIDFMAIC